MSTPRFYIEKVNEGLWLVVDSHNHVAEQFMSFEEAREYFLFINRKEQNA